MLDRFEGNLLSCPAGTAGREQSETLLRGGSFRLERIISTGQATPSGEWYDQEQPEWVVVHSGAARLRFENDAADRELRRGDYVFIPAHCRHRVEWTDPTQPTVWLAIHFSDNQTSSVRAGQPE
jgi:cupin 2 domain-containing protein